jgi:hypothetical protein
MVLVIVFAGAPTISPRVHSNRPRKSCHKHDTRVNRVRKQEDLRERDSDTTRRGSDHLAERELHAPQEILKRWWGGCMEVWLSVTRGWAQGYQGGEDVAYCDCRGRFGGEIVYGDGEGRGVLGCDLL